MDYRNINFGKSDAVTEGKKYPELLTEGYLDEMGMVKQAINSDKFLFLGYKGSGKSALSEHLRLTNRDRHDIFINDEMLKQFPYKLFNRIVKGDAEREAKYAWAWESVFLLYAVHSFSEDASCVPQDLHEWGETIDELKRSGLFPIQSITELVTRASKNTFKFKIPQFIEASRVYQRVDVNTDILIEYSKRLIKNCKTKSKHYLIVDGLDEFLSTRDQQEQTIIALINEAKDINEWFIENDINFKIIILCRTDVFIKLSDPNKNKIKQDYSYSINWFDENLADNYSCCSLINLANRRASMTYPELEDLFKYFFPEDLRGTPIHRGLLEFTRHTPRDFLQLLIHIQAVCRTKKVTLKDIDSGIKKYSLDYFQTEIRDELAGYYSSTDIDLTFQLLSSIKKKEFYFNDIQRIVDASPRYKDLDLYRIFSDLFECSAIGHKIGPSKYYIKYRNRQMSFNPSECIILHKGFYKALIG